MEPENSGKDREIASSVDSSGTDANGGTEPDGAGADGHGGTAPDNVAAALGADPRRSSGRTDSAADGQEKSNEAVTSRLKISGAERKPKRVPIQPDDSDTRKASKLPTNTNDLLQDAITGLYWIPAYATGIKEWELADEEAVTLADRVEAVLKSGDKKRAARIQKFVENVLPSISLVVAAAIITAPRIRLTQERRNHGVNPGTAENETRRNETGAPDNATPRGNNGNAFVGGEGEQQGRELRAVALTSADLDEFRSRDVVANG